MFDYGYSLILVYLLGGLAGTLYETYLNLKRKKGFVFCSGSIVTPFNFVYGIGGVLIYLSFFKLFPFLLTGWAWIIILISGTFLGGLVEYILSYLEEKICHTKSWDYTGKVGSINGRTTLPIMIGWGFLCLLVMYGVFYPLMTYLIKPYILDNPSAASIYHLVLSILICICAVDLFFVVLAILRYSQRSEHKPGFLPMGRIIDAIFSDSFMALHFPNSRKTTLLHGIKGPADIKKYAESRKEDFKALFDTRKNS